MSHLIDMKTWERREQFAYYTENVLSSYSITAELDVTLFRRMTAAHGLKFQPSFIYCVTGSINAIPEFRVRRDSRSGRLIRYDRIYPSYTVFHEDDHTFSDIWTACDGSFFDFYETYQQDILTYGSVKGIKAKPDVPPNMYCISCVPWLNFTACSIFSHSDEPSLLPIITYGKYHAQWRKWLMPFTVSISHAAADGYHVSLLIHHVQETINALDRLLRMPDGIPDAASWLAHV